MSLKSQFISSTFYMALTRYLGLIIQLVITGILSRILSPDDYGLVAITSVFVIFFGLFADMGIGPAVIQQQELVEEDLRSIFSFTCGLGVFLGSLFFLMAPLVSGFYERPVLNGMCKVLSIGLLCSCMNILPGALVLKEKRFRFLMFSQLAVQLTGGVVGVLAALQGWGVYALIVYSLVSGALLLAVNYARRPIIPSAIRYASLQKIARFSFYQFMFNFVNYFSRNIDNLLIGKYLSPVLLGYYEKSYKLMMLPVQNLTHVLSPAILPFFSGYQDHRQRIFSMYLKIVKVLALAGFPLSVVLYFTAPELILLIFGDRWGASVPVFEILAWSVGIQVVLSSSGAVFQAANDTRRLFLAGLLSAVVTVSAICTGVFVIGTIEGVARMICLAFLLNFMTGYYLLVKVTLGASLLAFVQVLVYPLVIALVVLVAEYLCVSLFTVESVFLSLLLKLSVAALVYLPMIYPVVRKEYWPGGNGKQ